MRIREMSTLSERHATRDAGAGGFSLLEVLVSVMIITVLMSAVFQFLRFTQQRYRGDQLLAERNQGARSALELMTQELQQAGHNPNFSPQKTLSAAASPTGGIVNISVSNTTGIIYGNLVANQILVHLVLFLRDVHPLHEIG